MVNTVEKRLPRGLRARLCAARLDLLALLRALDSLRLAQHLPDELRTILELDADLAEALVVLDHPAGGYDLAAMARDTLRSLERLPMAQHSFRATLSPQDGNRLAARIPVVRATLSPDDAYHSIPRATSRR
jgi:hypothetical protein